MYAIPVKFEYDSERDNIRVKFRNIQQLEDYIRSLPLDQRTFSRQHGAWVLRKKQLVNVVSFASRWSSHIDINSLPTDLKFLASKFMEGQVQHTPIARSPYTDLYVVDGAPMEVVRASYKALAKLYHPDNLESGDSQKFKIITESYNKIQSVRDN